MAKYTGYYIGQDGLPFDFYLKNRQLFYHIYGENNFSIKDAKDTFSIPADANIKFVFGMKGKDTTWWMTLLYLTITKRTTLEVWKVILAN